MSLTLTDTYLDEPYERKRYEKIIPRELLKELAEKRRVDENMMVGFCSCQNCKKYTKPFDWFTFVLFIIIAVIIAMIYCGDHRQYQLLKSNT